MADVWQKVVTVGGMAHRTQMYGIDADDGNYDEILSVDRPITYIFAVPSDIAGKAVIQLVIVPGNPGSALIYLPFLKIVHEALGGTADVVVFSHLAHDLKSKHGNMVGNSTL